MVSELLGAVVRREMLSVFYACSRGIGALKGNLATMAKNLHEVQGWLVKPRFVSYLP